MLYPRFKSVVLKSIIVRVFKCCCITVFIIQAAGQAPPAGHLYTLVMNLTLDTQRQLSISTMDDPAF